MKDVHTEALQSLLDELRLLSKVSLYYDRNWDRVRECSGHEYVHADDIENLIDRFS